MPNQTLEKGMLVRWEATPAVNPCLRLPKLMLSASGRRLTTAQSLFRWLTPAVYCSLSQSLGSCFFLRIFLFYFPTRIAPNIILFPIISTNIRSHNQLSITAQLHLESTYQRLSITDQQFHHYSAI
ncbi:hypothetical protein V2G26_000272 [Clonostachys chloroleuca]